MVQYSHPMMGMITMGIATMIANHNNIGKKNDQCPRCRRIRCWKEIYDWIENIGDDNRNNDGGNDLTETR